MGRERAWNELRKGEKCKGVGRLSCKPPTAFIPCTPLVPVPVGLPSEYFPTEKQKGATQDRSDDCRRTSGSVDGDGQVCLESEGPKSLNQIALVPVVFTRIRYNIPVLCTT